MKGMQVCILEGGGMRVFEPSRDAWVMCLVERGAWALRGSLPPLPPPLTQTRTSTHARSHPHSRISFTKLHPVREIRVCVGKRDAEGTLPHT